MSAATTHKLIQHFTRHYCRKMSARHTRVQHSQL